MTKLAALLKRSHKGLPSLVTAIENEIVKTNEEVFSVRAVNAALSAFNDAVKRNARMDMLFAFNTLQNAMNAERSREDKYIHVSELYDGCPRMFYYRVTGAPVSRGRWKPDAKLQMTFDVGTFYHKYIQKVLLRAGILRAAEVRVENQKLHLLGHNDGEGELDKTDFMLEIKTTNSYAYSQIVRKNAANESHKYQAGIYLKERNIDRVIFLYIDKNTSDMKEINTPVEKLKEHQDDAYDKLFSINEHIDKHKPPQRWCKTAMDKRALECRYCKHCFNL